MRRPTNEQFEIAIAWLDANEGAGDEAKACEVVAAWLEHCRTENLIKSYARKYGVSASAIREKLK